MGGGFRFEVPLCGRLVVQKPNRSHFRLPSPRQSAKRRRRIMSTGICKSPDSRYWRALYKAALSEIGNSKLLERITEAEKAVVLRARELFQAAGDLVKRLRLWRT